MTDRELMQQALDAFEWNLNTDLDNISACEKWIKKAKKNIDALRARLAQYEPEHRDVVIAGDLWRVEFLPNNNANVRLVRAATSLVCEYCKRDLKTMCLCVTSLHPEEKPNQTPVVWMYQDKSTNEVKFQKEMRTFVDHGATYEVPLYATPPKKWVSLTDEERDEICLGDEGICRAVEAKLKEKNGNL